MTTLEFFRAISKLDIEPPLKDYALQRLREIELYSDHKAAELKPYVDAILTYIELEGKTCLELVEQLTENFGNRADGKPFTIQFVSSIMQRLIAEGRATAEKVRVPGNSNRSTLYRGV